ncbi:MAG TPA: biotin--[acetyl-CoA-carboxylase] ligase, partial [Burkholderiaceae bacterium]|nr:biotin--[acetyl-CoA-carboxylase] ligase [Burkholderiaceae bacterium]
MHVMDEQALGADWQLACERAAGRLPQVCFEWAWEVDSTQAQLVGRARHCAPERTLVLAAWAQRSGKGRGGRAWLSQPGQALTLSVAMPWTGAPVIGAVTLACAVAVAETLRADGFEARLKWPNDVLLGGGKLAGLLGELVKDAHGGRTLVLGLGLNLGLPAQAQAMNAAALAQCRPMDEGAQTWCDWNVRMAASLVDALEAVKQARFERLVPRFDALFAWRDQPVAVFDPQLGELRWEGRALGIDAQGRLQLEVDGRSVWVPSGELSLRPD